MRNFRKNNDVTVNNAPATTGKLERVGSVVKADIRAGFRSGVRTAVAVTTLGLIIDGMGAVASSIANKKGKVD